MTRQEKNEQFLLSSFLYGGNADYIDGLYARFKADPKSVDPTWASYFGRLDDNPEDAKKNAEGPSWQRSDWPQRGNGELVSALDGDWGEVTRIVTKAQDAIVARAGKTDGAPTPSSADVIQAARDSVRAIMWDPLESTCRHASLSIL